jgi:hypothetical protein
MRLALPIRASAAAAAALAVWRTPAASCGRGASGGGRLLADGPPNPPSTRPTCAPFAPRSDQERQQGAGEAFRQDPLNPSRVDIEDFKGTEEFVFNHVFTPATTNDEVRARARAARQPAGGGRGGRGRGRRWLA